MDEYDGCYSIWLVFVFADLSPFHSSRTFTTSTVANNAVGPNDDKDHRDEVSISRIRTLVMV